MGYQKLKREEYKNIGGINTKASVYVTGETEVLDLVNYDLTTPGAWTPVPGLTTALTGNTLAIGASNRINFGFQTYRMFSDINGVSFTQKTYVVSNSFTYSLSLSNGVVSSVSGGTLTSTLGFGNSVNVSAPKQDSFTGGGYCYENMSFFVSGNTTFKANTSGIFYYGLPYYADDSGSFLSTGFTGTGSLTGTYQLKYAYSDFTSYIGPTNDDTLQGVNASAQFALYLSGATFTSKALASGATRVYVFASRVAGAPTSGYAAVGYLDALNPTLTISCTLGFLVPLAGTTLAPTVIPNQSTNSGIGAALDFTVGEATAVEFYANKLFWGIANGKNLIYYSDPIENLRDAQSVQPESFLAVQNSNQPFVGMKLFNQSLIVFFQKGVTRITGNNENNFNAQNMTVEYGLVSTRAIVTFNERLWFLDQNQIVEFNGASFVPVSERVRGYLNRMNVTAAQKTAMAYHFEQRNEVWFAIPIDGSNENNLILIFDYIANGWYARKSSSNFTTLQEFFTQTLVRGITASTVFLNSPLLYTGHPGGSFGFFGSSFTTDFGSGITCSFKTRYHTEGKSSTNEWRRFYLDTGPWAGTTLSFGANFYANYSTSTISLTRTIYAVGSPYTGPQESRIDFGIPAKSLSVEVAYSTSTNTPAFKVYGYTIESRFLRKT